MAYRLVGVRPLYEPVQKCSYLDSLAVFSGISILMMKTTWIIYYECQTFEIATRNLPIWGVRECTIFDSILTDSFYTYYQNLSCQSNKGP